jgi:hypothetical protein
LLFNTGAAVPVALTAGYILKPGDRVDTRGGGRVVIELSDGSMVVVSPESVVTLKDFRSASTLRELFEITIGIVRVKINHFGGKPNPYRMNSPTASIAVRGTEFTIEVDASGATEVTVIEGAVQVTSLADPARSILLQAGQSFRLIAGNLPPPGNRGDDRRGEQAAAQNNMAQAKGPEPHGDGPPPPPPGAPQGQPPQPPQPAPVGKAAAQPHNDRDSDETSPRGNAGTYNRYLAGLADIGQVPFMLRFNAFAEPHLDALENPAYATTFRSLEGRIYVLPTFHGAQTLQENQSTFGPGGSLPSDYSISPQISLFAPAGGFTFGGSASFSRVGSNSLNSTSLSFDGPMMPRGPDGGTLQTNGSSGTNFYSGALVAARRFGANSLGLEIASLKGTGSVSSTTTGTSDGYGHDPSELLGSTSAVTQTRLTLGYARDLSRDTRLGVYYRYAFINSNDRDTLHTINNLPAGLESTGTAGHSYEIGMRLRGQITPRLYYGIAGSWLGISLLDGLVRMDTTNSHERDRAHRGSVGVGLGYSLTRRTILTFDMAGGAAHNSALRTEDSTFRMLQNSGSSNRFVSVHGAGQHDLTRRLFLSASFLQVWQSTGLNVSAFPDRFGNTVQVSDDFFSLSPVVSSARRFSDYGVGWRFTPNLWVQYIYSTDYGVSPATHSLMLRYTFGKGR